MCNGWAVEAAARAAVKRAGEVRLELRRGTTGLAMVSGTAPLFGIFGTCIGIITSFGPANGDKWTIIFGVIGRLADAPWPSAFGLAVAVTAVWVRSFVQAQTEAFDREMRECCRSLVARLSSLQSGEQPAGEHRIQSR